MSEKLIQELNNTITNIPNFPKEGIQFKDITPIFLNPQLYQEVIDTFVENAKGKVDVVCGIESRGYLFGIAIAVALGVPFVLIRKKGKLPPPFIGEKYDLEYGSSEIEMKVGQIKAGQRVMIHDDLLATGGTAAAARKLVEKQGAKTTLFSFLVELQDLSGRKKLEETGVEIFTILEY